MRSLREGALSLKELPAERDGQNYGGWLVIGYEADWENNMESIRKRVEFLRNNWQKSAPRSAPGCRRTPIF